MSGYTLGHTTGLQGMLAAVPGETQQRGGEEESSLAAEVLPVSDIFAQDVQQGGQYIFQAEDVENALAGNSFGLTRDDTLHLIGLLNSPAVDIAKRELGVLLGRLERPAVEGLTRRLFAALRRRTAEMADLEDKALNATQKGSAGQGVRRPVPVPVRRAVRREEVMPQDEQRSGSKQQALDDRRSAPAASTQIGRSKSEELLRPLPQQRRVIATTAPAPTRATVLAVEGQGQYPAPSQRPPQRVSQGAPSGKPDHLPQVFRRLTEGTASAYMASDEVVRGARAAMGMGIVSPAQPGLVSPPLTIGGVPSNEGGPQASAYLEALLEAHECETGVPATSSRRPMAEDMDPLGQRSPRVPEEKAKEIFDRLYRSGKEHRVRRRVYHELGLLVEQAKEAQTCTFEPRVPLAAYPGNQPPEGSVTERLYREGLDRIRRREELMLTAPIPTFRPTTMAPPPSIAMTMGRTGQMRQMMMDQGEGMVDEEGNIVVNGVMVDEEGMVIEGQQEQQQQQQQLVDDGMGMGMGMVANYVEPPHERLFRENENRQARKRERIEAEAEWRKFSYKPDTSRSMRSGPLVVRSSSYAGFPQGNQDDGFETTVVTAADEAQGPSLGDMEVGALQTPRSAEDAIDDGQEALLLVFPDSRTPAAEGFEEELVNGLALLGADFLSEVSLRLLGGDCIVAELQGPRESLAMLQELPLFDLTVSGFRVGEVRLTSTPGLYNVVEDDLAQGYPRLTGEGGDSPGGRSARSGRQSATGLSPKSAGRDDVDFGASSVTSPDTSPTAHQYMASASQFQVPRSGSQEGFVVSSGQFQVPSTGGARSYMSAGAKESSPRSSARSAADLQGAALLVQRQSSGPYAPYGSPPNILQQQMQQQQQLSQQMQQQQLSGTPMPQQQLSQVSEQGFTLSREASSATFQSAAMMTPTNTNVQRRFSGTLTGPQQPQQPQQQPQGPGMGQAPPGGRGAGAFGQQQQQGFGPGPGASSGSGVRYPAALNNMPSTMGFNTSSQASPQASLSTGTHSNSALSVGGGMGQPAAPSWASPRGGLTMESAPQPQMLGQLSQAQSYANPAFGGGAGGGGGGYQGGGFGQSPFVGAGSMFSQQQQRFGSQQVLRAGY